MSETLCQSGSIAKVHEQGDACGERQRAIEKHCPRISVFHIPNEQSAKAEKYSCKNDVDGTESVGLVLHFTNGDEENCKLDCQQCYLIVLNGVVAIETYRAE